MHSNFRTHQLSLELCRGLKGARLPHGLRDQLIRAASSVCLNLSEGSAKPTRKDRLRFYSIALGSLREVQTLIEMESEVLGQHSDTADRLAAHLYKLTRS